VPVPDLQLELPALSARLPEARHRVREFCERVRLDEEIIERVQFAVHEAAANAVVHGYRSKPRDTTYMVEASITADALVVVVHDHGVGIAPSSAPPPTERRGVGLRLIHALSDHANISSQAGRGTRVEMQFGIGKA